MQNAWVRPQLALTLTEPRLVEPSWVKHSLWQFWAQAYLLMQRALPAPRRACRLYRCVAEAAR